MASLQITCTSVKLKGLLQPGLDYFLLLQLNQANDTDLVVSSQKLRSEYYRVDRATSMAERRPDEIRFAKNVFKFESLDPFLTYNIKLGVFRGDQAEVVCAGQIKIDSHEFEIIFDQTDATASRMVKLNQVGQTDEIGQAFLEVKLEITSFEYQIFRDNQKVQEHYFDAHCKDETIIKSHLNSIEELLQQRSKDYPRVLTTYEKRTEQLSELAVDLAQLRSLKELENGKVEKVRDRVRRLQNVDEIHIEIDVLSSTATGVQQLKERLQKLRLRLALQQQQYDKLSDDFQTVKPQLSSLKQIMMQVQTEQQIGDAIKFEIARLQPVQERIAIKKETLVNQEEIIASLVEEVKYRQGGGKQTTAVREQLMELAEKELLREQLRQQRKAKEPLYRKTKEEELTLEKLQAENTNLYDRIQQVNREIDALERPSTALVRDGNALDSNQRQKWMKEREGKKLQMKQAEASANNLQRELKHRAKIHASHIAQLKMQLTALSTLVNENLND